MSGRDRARDFSSELKHVVRNYVTPIAAICGLVSLFFTFSDRRPGGSGPLLELRALGSGGDRVAIAPMLQHPDSTRFLPIPFLASIRNTGVRTAVDVTLQVESPFGIQWFGPRGRVLPRVVMDGAGSKELIELVLGDVHPGQVISLADSLYIAMEHPIGVSITGMPRDRGAVQLAVGPPLIYEFNCSAISRDARRFEERIQFTIGSPAGLDSTEARFLEVTRQPGGKLSLDPREGRPKLRVVLPDTLPVEYHVGNIF